jgi:hypothetical protein
MPWIVLEPWCLRCRKVLAHDDIGRFERGGTLCKPCATPHLSQALREILGEG